VATAGGRGWTQLRLAGSLRRSGAEVLFNPIPILPLLARLSCPAVVTVHDLHEFRAARWWYLRRLLSATFSRASAVVAVSEATRHEVEREFPGVAGKLTVVHEGADPVVFHPSPSGYPPAGGSNDVLARLGIAEPPLLAVGTIHPRKNYARLIRAYARLAPGVAPPMVIVGRRGWEADEVFQLPAALGIEDRVFFTGHLGEQELAELMRFARLLIALSLGEGFGLPLVEAMHCGLPILASDIPPFREVAGNAARFVDPLDEAAIASRLDQLLADGSSLAEMSAVGLGRRQLFTWPRAAAAIVDILRRAANEPLTTGR
jgi:glycosyltransferase involved in cell wall biosynthesis